MAQLAVSVAGAVVGSFFGPVGAQVGWAAGSLLGAALFGESTQGPRLSDTKVQISGYGTSLPITWGGVRISGNVIWSTDLSESSSSSGGKGGPSVTTFTYSVSCAIAICEGEIGAIRRIWADAKLVYDATDGSDSLSQAASAAFREYMTVYLGSETQLPDATIEAVEGSGNVEAYRGVAYVVFTDLPLGDYGNRVPLFSFETTSEPEDIVSTTLREPLRVYRWEPDGDGRPVHSAGDTYYSSPYLGDSGTDFQTIAEDNAASFTFHEYGYGPFSSEWINAYRSSRTTTTWNFDGADILGTDPEYVWYGLGVDGTGLWDLDGRSIPLSTFQESLAFLKGVRYFRTAAPNGANPYVVKRMEGLAHTTTTEDPGHPFYSNIASGITEPDTCTFFTCILSVAWAYPLLDMSALRVPTHKAKSCYAGDPCSSGDTAGAELPGNSDFCITCDGVISLNADWTIISGTAKQLCAVEYRDGVLYQNALGPVLLPGDPDYSNTAFWDDAATDAITAGTMAADVSYPVVVSQYAEGTTPDIASAAPGTVLLSTIVSDICARAGLQSSQINVTALTDEVEGYRVSRQMSARAALEPLRQAYYVDAVENGPVVQFVKRGGASVVTIPPESLGAADDVGGSVLITPTRAQETELPAEVNVTYEVRAADYQVGTQQARRSTTGSQQVRSVELPIVMPDDKGAEVADVLMVDTWQGRVERAFATLREYTYLLPCDVVRVDDGSFVYEGRITEKLENGPIIEWKMRDTAAATYSPNAQASETSGGGSAIHYNAPIRVTLMDLPALRDVDNEAGFYAVASPFGDTIFRGGRLFQALDLTNYSAIQNLNVAGVVGTATTALADFDGGNIVDETNSVTVQLTAGELSSVTRAQQLNHANACMLGGEVLCFRSATLLSPRTYRLAGLLRGRVGTEREMGVHAVGEAFALLDLSNVYRVQQDLSEIGAANYRAVAYGTFLESSPTQGFTNTGMALKPYSPVHLYAADIGGGEYRVQWVRRSRIGGKWLDISDVPLGESSELYEVEVVRGAVVQSVASVSSPTADVEAAAGDTVNVYQISGTVGRGFPASITLE